MKGVFCTKRQFPRTQVENVSLSRILSGTNWLLGWSHTSASADEMIKRRYDSAEAFKPVLEAYLRHGVDSMTIKAMAAGRCSPYVGLTFSWNAIRAQDMVTVGAFTPDEAEEDIEISLAAIEHRFPDLEKRGSPNQEQAAFGKG